MTVSSARSTRIPLQKVRISESGYHLQLYVHINDTKALLTLDTGASDTVFDTRLIEQMLSRKTRLHQNRLSAGLGTSEMESRHIRIPTLQIGRLCIPSERFTCLDLQNLNDTYHSLGIPRVAGVLGSDILNRFDAHISYTSLQLILRTGTQADTTFAKKAYFVV